MLSAVAARKARLAQSQTQTPPVPQPPSPEPESKNAARTAPSSSAPKPPSKRKPSASAGNPPKKKRVQRRKDPLEQRARYFAQEDAFTTQNDVILVGESEDGSSATSSSVASDDEARVARPQHVGATRSGRAKRPWSPSAPLPDSSDEDGEPEDESVLLDTPLPQRALAPDEPKILSTFKPILDRNVYHLPAAGDSAQKCTVLLLRASETLAFLGVYSLTVLRGAVSLAGVTLSASSAAHPVYAPRSSPLPIIQCLPYSASASCPVSPSTLPGDIADAASGFDAIVVLQALNTGVDGLGRICRTFDSFFAPSRWQRDQPRFDFGLDGVYFMPFQTPDIAPLLIPATWAAGTNDILSTGDEDAQSRRRVCMVKGPKNAGKSTLARLLLNKLLSRFRRVAYLECDLGQSEFTLGGMVSLSVVEEPVFGPPFTHPSMPFAAHFIGATSPKTSPSHYLDSIQALMQQYEIDVRNAVLDEDSAEEEEGEDGRIGSTIPLVVNTMGWTKGLGADLARKVEQIVEPSDVFSLSGDDDQTCGRGPTFDVVQPYPGNPRIHAVESVPPSATASHYTAADQRNLSILSYFHAVFPQGTHSSPYSSPAAVAWNTTLPLCAQPPYEVDCQTALDKLVLTGAGSEDVVPSEVRRALSCAIVGLVACEPGTLEATPPQEGSTAALLHYEQGATPPLPSASNCVGLALVRAISPGPQSSMQLLTPIPPYRLASSRVLVMGELQLPVWGMLDFRTLDDGGEIAGYERGKVPYLRWGKGEGAGGERRRVRRNLMRKGQT
ncbi:hypothetical protein OH77DRAFT_1497803 [Trametes cingulata]|nr:hypothetical protein OH77DRAFT_1497803 [Trametes cingulata]